LSAIGTAAARGHRRGILMMIGATLCWGSAGVLVRSQGVTDPWEITFWRSFFMAIFLFCVLAVQYRRDVWRRIGATGVGGIVSACLWSVMYVCFIVALSRTTVANTLVVCSISPFMAALFGRIFLGERVPTRTWLAMAAAVGGIVLMFIESLGTAGAAGTLIALVIPVAFGVNVVLNRKMHASVDMVPTVLVSGVLSAALVLPLALPFDARAADFPNLVALGVVQLGLGCMLMVVAARRLAAAEIGLLAELETVIGVGSTWLLVGEVPSRMALIGGSVVIAALAFDTLLGLRRPRPVPVPTGG
jgi:drug/metabolite transporter (DMT)-like permease